MTAAPSRFSDFINRFFESYTKRDFSQALQIIETEGHAFPAREPQIMLWQSGMLSLLGRLDDAMQVLESAYARGYWCDEEALTCDPDYEPLKAHPKFTGMVEQMALRHREALAHPQKGRKEVLPAQPGSHPLLLALHGNFSNIGQTEGEWQSAVKAGWLLALAQSSQLAYSSGIGVWDDVEKSTTEVYEHLAELAAQYPIDPKAVVVGGFSMGAHIAVRLALDPNLQLRGVIAVEPWFNEEAMPIFEQLAAACEPTQTRVFLIVGKENTEYLAMASKIQALLQAKGMQVHLAAASNAAHGYPAEMEQLLEQALAWIMQ